MRNDSEVSFEFDGPESGGVQIESLSRGDKFTVKGKVYLGTEKLLDCVCVKLFLARNAMFPFLDLQEFEQ